LCGHSIGQRMALRPSKKTREKRVSARYKTTSSVAPIEQAKKDVSLVRALSEIVSEPASAKAKLAKIETLIAVPIVASSPKRRKTSDNLPTDDHSVKSLQGKIAREFKHIPDKSRNSVAASISVRQNNAVDIDSVADDILDIERGLESLLAKHGVKRKVRDELARAFARVATKAKSGQDVQATITAINKLDFNEASQSSNVPPLPKKAPILYDARDKSQNIVDFLLDPNGWGPWVRLGALPRQTLRQLDPSAYAALNYWLRTYGLPPDIEIPTRTQLIDRVVASGTIPVAEAPRLARTLLRRAERARTNRQP